MGECPNIDCIVVCVGCVGCVGLYMNATFLYFFCIFF